MVYFLTGILVLAGVVFHDLLKSVRSSRFWVWGFRSVISILVLIATLRYRIGFDTMIMDDIFSNQPLLSNFSMADFNRSMGGRHALFYSICKSLGTGLWPVQLLCASVLNIATGVMIRHYTRNWFIALGLYLCFAYITLNFEIMWQGLAAGFVVWGIDDLRKGNIKIFYLKLLPAIIAHLSAFILIGLPLVRLPLVKRWLCPGWRLAVATCIILLSGFLIRCFLLSLSGFGENIELFNQLKFTSDAINEYSTLMFNPPGLNYKGIIRNLFLFVICPLGCAFLLYKSQTLCKSNFSENKEESASHKTIRHLSRREIMAIMCSIFAILQFCTLFMGIFQRISFYFLIFTVIGAAESLACITSRRGKTAWWCITVLAIALSLYNFSSRPKGNDSGYLFELYYPYANVIDKGISHHREWLYINYIRSDLNQPKIKESELYYHLEPYNYYIDPPLCDTTNLKNIPYYY